MLYVRTQFLDSSEFRSRAETALASPDVQDYLADALTARLVARGGPEAERAEPLVRSVVGGVVTSQRFEDVFGRAVLGLHARLLSEDAAPRVVQLQEALTGRWTRSRWSTRRLPSASGTPRATSRSGRERRASAWPSSPIAPSSCACSGSSFRSWPLS